MLVATRDRGLCPRSPKCRVLLALTMLVSLGAPPAAATPSQPDTTDMRSGRTEGGLSYVVDRVPAESRVYIGLAIKAGHSCDDPPSSGVAHLVEHLVYNTPLRRERNVTIAQRAVKWGGVLGYDFNAFTHDRQTNYWLSVPADDPNALIDALDLMDQWLRQPDFSVASIAREHKAVTEEMRPSGDPEVSALEAVQRAMGAVSREEMAERFAAIGTDPKAVHSFFGKYYRPANAVVAISGDIDPGRVAKLIEGRFGKFKKTVTGGPAVCGVASNSFKEGIFVARSANLPLETLDIRFDLSSPAAEARKGSERAVAALIEHRLAPFRDQYSSSIVWSDVAIEGAASPRTLTLRLGVAPGKLFEATGVAFGIIRWQAEHEVSAFDAAQAAEAADIEPAPALGARLIAMKRLDAFGNGNPFETLPQVEGKVEGEPERAITGAELTEYSKLLLTLPTQVVAVAQSESGGSQIDSASFQNLAEKARLNSLITPVVGMRPGEILPLPRYGKADLPTFTVDTIPGGTRLTLANGRSLVALDRASGAGNEEVEVQILAAGGLDDVEGDDYLLDKYAAEVIENSGLAGLDKFGTRKLLSAYGIELSSSVQTTRRSFRMRFPAKFLEGALRLGTASLLWEKVSDESYADWLQSTRRRLATGQLPPASMLDGAIETWRSGKPVPRLDEAALARLTASQFARAYRHNMSALSNGVVVIRGVEASPENHAILARFLASLPSEGNIPRRPISEKKSAHSPGTTVLTGNSGGRATAKILFEGIRPANVLLDRNLAAVGKDLSLALEERLRRREQGVYSVMVSASASRLPDRYAITVEFSCASANLERLVAAAQAEIATYVSGPIPTWVQDEPTALPVTAAAEPLLAIANRLLVSGIDKPRSVSNLPSDQQWNQIGAMLDPTRSHTFTLIP